MRKIFIYLMLLFTSSDAYVNIKPIKHNRKIIRKPTKVKLSCNLSDNTDTLIKHLSNFNSDCKTIIGKKIVHWMARKNLSKNSANFSEFYFPNKKAILFN